MKREATTNWACIVIYMFHNILYYPLTLPLSSDILTIMDTTDKLIITAKKLALQQMITKIQDEIEKLEDEEKKADEIPF